MDKGRARCWQEKANLLAKQMKDGRPLKEIYFEAINGHYRLSVRETRILTVGEEKNVSGGMTT